MTDGSLPPCGAGTIAGRTLAKAEAEKEIEGYRVSGPYRGFGVLDNPSFQVAAQYGFDAVVHRAHRPPQQSSVL